MQFMIIWLVLVPTVIILSLYGLKQYIQKVSLKPDPKRFSKILLPYAAPVVLILAAITTLAVYPL